MTYTEILNLISEMFSTMIYKLNEIKDALFGSFVFALYNHYYYKKELKNNIIEFFIGVIFAVYVSPVLHQYFTVMNINALSFFSGMLGMKFTHLLLATNWNHYLNRFLEKKIEDISHPSQEQNNEHTSN